MTRIRLLRNPRAITIFLLVLTVILAAVAIITAISLQNKTNVNPDTGKAGSCTGRSCQTQENNLAACERGDYGAGLDCSQYRTHRDQCVQAQQCEIQCGTLNASGSCIPNNTGKKTDGQVCNNADECLSNVCATANQCTEKPKTCGGESPANCTPVNNPTQAPTTTTTTTPVPTSDGQLRCPDASGNVCSPGSMCNPENTFECLPKCDGTKDRCNCLNNPCIKGVHGNGLGKFTCGANGATCTGQEPSGWARPQAACRYVKGGGECARAEFRGSCNPAVNKMCMCNGGTAYDGGDGYIYHDSITTDDIKCTVGNISAEQLCANRSGIVNGDGTTCGNIYRCPTKFTTTPTTTTTTVVTTQPPVCTESSKCEDLGSGTKEWVTRNNCTQAITKKEPAPYCNTTCNPTAGCEGTNWVVRSCDQTVQSSNPDPRCVQAPQFSCLGLTVEPAGPYTAGSTPRLKVTTTGRNNASYNYVVEVRGDANTQGYTATFNQRNTNVNNVRTDDLGTIAPLNQVDRTKPATYTVQVKRSGTLWDARCQTSFTLQPQAIAKCENLYIDGNPALKTKTLAANGTVDITLKVTNPQNNNANLATYNKDNRNSRGTPQSANLEQNISPSGFTPQSKVTNNNVTTSVFNTTGTGGTYTFKLRYDQLLQKDLNFNNNVLTNIQLNGYGGGSAGDANCVVSLNLQQSDYTVIKKAFVGENEVGVVKPGDKITYRIEASNPGATARTGVTIVDTFDSQFLSKFTIDNISNGGVRSGNSITWTNQTIPAASGSTPGKLTLTFDATVNADFFSGLNVCSQVVKNNVNSTIPVETPPYEIHVTVVNPTCNDQFTIEKSVNPQIVGPAGTVTYTGKITNVGSAAQPIVRIVDDYPDPFTYVNGSATFVKPDGSSFKKDPEVQNGKLIWEFGSAEQVTLQPNQQMSVSYQMIASQNTGSYVNTICLEVPNGGCDDTTVTVQQLCKAGDAGCGIETKDIVKYIGIALVAGAAVAYAVMMRRRNNNLHIHTNGLRRPLSTKTSKNKSFDDKLDEVVKKLKK